MEELTTSSELLKSALERYYNACTALELDTYHNFTQPDIRGTFLETLTGKLAETASHEEELKRCKMALRRIRNRSPTITPINALPPEVLIRIFKILASCCFENHNSLQVTTPMYPDSLAHVCTRWRQIAIGSCVLWSHIDLSPSSDNNLGQRLLDRGKVFASRSSNLPLQIHIVGNNGDGNDLTELCTAIAKRATSLEVFTGSPNVNSTLEQFKRTYSPVFNTCFKEAMPGTLNYLAIRAELSKYSFIRPDATDGYLESFTAQNEAERIRLDRLLREVSVLHLGIGCIPPTSQVYQGLVELRLMGPDMRLTETQFLGILVASPRLRILYVDVRIWNPSRTPAKVQLEELEVLFVSLVEDNANLLRLLCPGVQPLKLVLEIRKSLPISQSTMVEFMRLFKRSTVTEFYAHQVKQTSGFGQISFNPFQLLELAPHLQILALSGIKIERPLGRLANKLSTPTADNPDSSLHTLHLVKTQVYCTDLLDLFQLYGTRRVTIWDCTVRSENDTSGIQDQEYIRSMIANARQRPAVQILSDSIFELAGIHGES